MLGLTIEHAILTGVQDMACDTFIKISQKCKRHFVMQQAGESEPFIDEILRNLHRITGDLQPQQVKTCQKANRPLDTCLIIVCVITGTHLLRGRRTYDLGSASQVGPRKAYRTPDEQPERFGKSFSIRYMWLKQGGSSSFSSLQWLNMMMRQSNGVDVLSDPENVKQIGNVLKTNVAACVAIGPYFLPQLGKLWVDMLGLYGAASNNVSEAVAQQGTQTMVPSFGMSTTDDTAVLQVSLLPGPPRSERCEPSRRRS